MWEIENPIKVFSYIYNLDIRKNFSLVALMTKVKYDSFSQEDIISLENEERINVKTVKIKNPNNPAQLMDAELLTLWW
jgi:hypothetical protein